MVWFGIGKFGIGWFGIGWFSIGWFGIGWFGNGWFGDKFEYVLVNSERSGIYLGQTDRPTD